MTDFVLDMNINNCAVTVEFDMLSEGLDMSTVKVLAYLPIESATEEGFRWVQVNDMLSDKDWEDIELEIAWNYDKLMIQKEARDN